MYRDPNCYLWDLEKMIGKSNSTAKRVMKRIRTYYGLTGRQRPTIQQVKEYLVQI